MILGDGLLSGFWRDTKHSDMSGRSRHFYPICLALFLAAGAWGLYWLPQRALETAGLTGGWGTIAQFLICLTILTPIAIWRAQQGRQTGLDLPLAGLLMGGGIVCYANSFLLTDVIRALLLFYLTPVWATLVEVLFLQKRPAWGRWISLPLSVLGVWLVIGGDLGVPVPRNAGDWLALAGGALFVAGAARTEVVRLDGISPMLFAFFFYGSLFAFGQSLFLKEGLGPAPQLDAVISLLPWLLLIALGFMLPTNVLITWSPSQIGTGLFSILILAELVFGAVSAAALAGEPFGWRETVGSGLILSAGLLEVALPKR